MCFVFIFIFFSSRRRHTRLRCDGRSDVYSSDFVAGGAVPLPLRVDRPAVGADVSCLCLSLGHFPPQTGFYRDRKSTRLNSSHMSISYAVFCLKKKKYCIHLYMHVTSAYLCTHVN